MAQTSSKSYLKNFELKPQWMRNNQNTEFTERIRKFNLITEKQNMEERNKKKKFLDSDNFDRLYSLPYNLHNEYINNPYFDLDYYLIENIQRRHNTRNNVFNRADALYEQFRENYFQQVKNLDENSFDFDNFYYKDDVFIDDSLDRIFCQDINDILKREFGSDYFNPYDN